MSWVDLPTNFKNLVWSGLKKFNQISNQDGTVSFEDVTVYQDTEGTQMTASQLNQMTGAINDMMNGELFIGDAPADGEEYVRKNNNWAVASGGGGGSVSEPITVYVDGTNGSDSNDGSSEHPFATIAKAISEVPAGIMNVSLIGVAAGTYAERLDIESKSVTLLMGGDVTINNIMQVSNNSYVRIYGPSGRTLTLNSSLTVQLNSVVLQEMAIAITSQYSALAVIESKFVNSYNKTLTLISTGNSTYGVYATNSSLVFLGTVNITAETGIKSTTGAIVAYDTLTGTMTTQTVQDIGGRIYTGSGGSGSATAWGDITGTLSNQTDLNTALAAKANTGRLCDRSHE